MQENEFSTKRSYVKEVHKDSYPCVCFASCSSFVDENALPGEKSCHSKTVSFLRWPCCSALASATRKQS